jgi:hypothetical protein
VAKEGLCEISHASHVVDAVVTWVDGSDLDHAKHRRAVLEDSETKNSSTIPAGLDSSRFENNNEIEYCLRSIRKFAPWIRTIHLVTDKQCPRFLTAKERHRLGIELVDHTTIFAGHEKALPTFNSLSIETVLHRIPGVAPNYIYLNDDFILLGPTAIEDFFTRQGVVLRGTWRKLRRYGKARLALSKLLNHLLKRLFGINRAMSMLQQIRGAELAGARGMYFAVVHAPYPIKRDTIRQFFQSHRAALAKNISYRFRSTDQYATTSLANHLEISGGHARLMPPDDSLMICFNRDSLTQVRMKIKSLQSGKFRFLCIQSLEEAPCEERRALLSLVRALTM